MNIILSTNNMFLDIDVATKQDLFNLVADKLIAKEIVSDKQVFIDGLNAREAQSPTGFENGIAIPHVQSDAVNKATLVVVRTKDEIKDYESMMPNQVRLVFLIAVPKTGGDEHLKVLSTLATKLMDKKLIDSLMKANKEEVITLLSGDKKEETKEVNTSDSKGLILAVTACATGIAHTYMSAEAIEKIAAENGYEVKVEKQGASGIEDKISAEDVARATCVILAHDVELMELNRFEGLKYIDVKVAKPMHEPQKSLDDAINSSKTYVARVGGESNDEAKSLGSEMMQAMMTGISYMIPVIVAGGLLMGIAKLAALGLGGDELVQAFGSYLPLGSTPDGYDANWLYTFLAYIDKIGWTIMQFMYPVFAMYLAYSIAGKNALLPGFLGGIFAQGLHTRIWGFDTMPSGVMYPFVDSHQMAAVPSGFIGALILGFVAGYTVRKLNKIKIHKNLASMKTMLIIPGVSVLVIVLCSMFVVEPVFGAFNMWLQKIITNNSESQYIYAVSIAAATAFDLGGPVNKAAGAVAMGLAADGTIAMTARTLAIVIPPLGLGLAVIIDSLIKTDVFTEDEKVVGPTSFLLGFLAISEGAIPFMLKNPLVVIPINIIGAILGSVVAIALGAEMWLPLPAIWGWPLVEGSVFAYLIGLIVGMVFIAIANIVVRKMLNNK